MIRIHAETLADLERALILFLAAHPEARRWAWVGYDDDLCGQDGDITHVCFTSREVQK